MEYIKNTDDFILVGWTHPTNKTDKEVQHYNTALYSPDDMDHALKVYNHAVEMKNTPAFVFYNNKFVKHSYND